MASPTTVGAVSRTQNPPTMAPAETPATPVAPAAKGSGSLLEAVLNAIGDGFELKNKSLRLEKEWCDNAKGLWNKAIMCSAYFQSRKPMP